MNHQDLINTCIFEQIQGLLFSDLSGPLSTLLGVTHANIDIIIMSKRHSHAIWDKILMFDIRVDY